MYKEKFQEWGFVKRLPRKITGKLLRIADERKPKDTVFSLNGKDWTAGQLRKKHGRGGKRVGHASYGRQNHWNEQTWKPARQLTLTALSSVPPRPSNRLANANSEYIPGPRECTRPAAVKQARVQRQPTATSSLRSCLARARVESRNAVSQRDTQPLSESPGSCLFHAAPKSRHAPDLSATHICRAQHA